MVPDAITWGILARPMPQSGRPKKQLRFGSWRQNRRFQKFIIAKNRFGEVENMDKRTYMILDLATDSSESICLQLVDYVRNKHNGATKTCIMALMQEKLELQLSSSWTIIAETNIDLIFKAKCSLDESGITDFTLITTRIMKKYWEYVCFLLFSNVHNWSVVGVDVSDQHTNITIPDLTKVKPSIREYLMDIRNTGEVEILRGRVIPDSMFNAGYHTRTGGVSQLKPLGSMNMVFTVRKPDSMMVITENQRRLAEAAHFDVNELFIAKTEHGKKVWVVGKDENQPPKYDGVVTNIPGVTVAAPGADCAVILLADSKTGACGAVHAGWRGTVLGAVTETLNAMIHAFGTDPQDICASIGPSITADYFTMPVSDATVLMELDATLTWPSNKKEGWVHVDLQKANAVMLEKAGVPGANIDFSTALCTVANEDKFFSNKRDTFPFGNQLGFISCRKTQKADDG